MFRKVYAHDNTADQFSVKAFYINKYGVYYTNPGSDDVIDMIRFDEIISKQEYDTIKAAYQKEEEEQKVQGREDIECCKSITEPRMYDIEVGFEAVTLNCIFIKDPEYSVKGNE